MRNIIGNDFWCPAHEKFFCHLQAVAPRWFLQLVPICPCPAVMSVFWCTKHHHYKRQRIERLQGYSAGLDKADPEQTPFKIPNETRPWVLYCDCQE